MANPLTLNPAAPLRLPAPPPIPRRSDGRYDVDAIRSLFPVTERWAYMNHAAVSPLPGPAAQAMLDCVTNVALHGSNSYLAWYEAYSGARAAAARALNAQPDDIALLKNTSEGVSTVAFGFPFQPGDNVVGCAEEFPANVRPWQAQAARGVEFRVAPLQPAPDGSPSGAIDPAAIEALCDAKTRVLAISAVEFASGFAHDLARLGEFCRRRGIFFFVDIIQAFGGRSFDAQALNIAAAAADSHKWMLGPEGSGILFVAPAWRERIAPLGAGWFNYDVRGDYLNYAAPLFASGRKYECGTLNTIGIYGMLAAQLLTEAIGYDQIWAHVLEVTDHAVQRLAPLGYRPFAPRGATASGIVSFVPPAAAPLKSIVHRLETDHQICVTHRNGRLRISPHLYNIKAEIDRLADALAALS